ncbi:MAG: GNAT family N-acetyltransferase [Motilibacteraceae bacterium]
MTEAVHRHGSGSLREPWVRSGVAGLLRSAVSGGAALGWVDPPEPGELDVLLAELALAAATGDADVALLTAGTDVLGFGYWRRYARPTHRPHADLERLVVAPSARGHGHGRGLLRTLVESARAAGVEVLTLDVRGDNDAAISLYVGEGFTEYGRLPGFVAVGDARWDKVFMARRLDGEQVRAELVHAQPVQVTDHLVGWVVLQREDGCVLLARRAGVAYADGLWGLPGGHVEDDETVAAGAARELREEVGVRADAAVLEPIGVTRYVDGPNRGTDFFFRALRWEGDPAPVAECSEVGWFDPAQLPGDALPWLGTALRHHLLDGRWMADHPAS